MSDDYPTRYVVFFANFIGPLRPQRRSGSSEEGMEPFVQPLHHQNIDLNLHPFSATYFLVMAVSFRYYLIVSRVGIADGLSWSSIPVPLWQRCTGRDFLIPCWWPIACCRDLLAIATNFGSCSPAVHFGGHFAVIWWMNVHTTMISSTQLSLGIPSYWIWRLEHGIGRLYTFHLAVLLQTSFLVTLGHQRRRILFLIPCC